MFSLRRRLPVSSRLFLAGAGLCAVLAFLLVRGEAARRTERPGAAGPVSQVVVAARELPPGVTLTPADVQLVELPTAYVPPGAVGAVADVVGHVANGPVAEGEALTATRLSDAGGPLPVSLPPGSVAVQIRVAAVPEGLRSGDHVDVLATAGTGRSYTNQIAEDLTVLALPDGGTDTMGAAAEPWALLLAGPDEARELVNAEAYARLSLAVRAAAPLATAAQTPSSASAPSPGAMPSGS